MNSLWNGETLNTDNVPSKSGDETIGIESNNGIKIIWGTNFFIEFKEYQTVLYIHSEG